MRSCVVFSGDKFGEFFNKSFLGRSLDELAHSSDIIAQERWAMDLATSMAYKNALLTYPNPAVGCVVVSASNKLLAASAHRIKGGFHAERKALLLARRLWGEAALVGSRVFVTLEPCSKIGATPACTSIILQSGCKQVIYAEDDGTQSGASLLASKGVLVRKLANNAASALARAFFAKDFAVFKQALRKDGSTSGKISCDELACYTHEIRSKLPTIATFGNTVRSDLPRLDARRSISKKAPNLVVFSRFRQSMLAPKAPCWSVLNRSVSVREWADDALAGCGAVLVEGGKNALKLAANSCNWLLLHFDESLSENESRIVAANPARFYDHLAGLNLQPLALGKVSCGQCYCFYEILHE